MKLGIKSAIVLIALVAFSIAAEYKIGYVDIEKIENEYAAFESARKELTVITQKLEKEIKVIADSIMAIEKTVQTQANILSEEKKKKLLQDYQVLGQQYQQLQYDANMKVANKTKELQEPIMVAVEAAIKSVASEGKYSFILQNRVGVLYADPMHDITAKVLTKLNKK